MRNRSAKRPRNQRRAGSFRLSAGFTMMEMMIGLAILSIAFGTIYKSFEHLNRSTATENVKAGVQQAARIAVDFMVQDIRLAGLNPLGTPGIGIQAASSDSIQFTMDANFDGDDADTFENISYAFNPGSGTLRQFNPPLIPTQPIVLIRILMSEWDNPGPGPSRQPWQPGIPHHRRAAC